MTGRGWGDLALDASSGGQRFALTWKTRIRLSRRTGLFPAFRGFCRRYYYLCLHRYTHKRRPRVVAHATGATGLALLGTDAASGKWVKNCQNSGALRERKLPYAK